MAASTWLSYLGMRLTQMLVMIAGSGRYAQSDIVSPSRAGTTSWCAPAADLGVDSRSAGRRSADRAR